mgnify:CR=1 FL=1
MKKKLVVMCMLFITCVVTSCSGNNNGKTEADNIQTQTFPQQYRYSSEHLRIDLQEITPQEVHLEVAVPGTKLFVENNTSGSKLEEWNRDGMFVGL